MQAVQTEHYNATNKYALVQNIPEFINNTKIPDDDNRNTATCNKRHDLKASNMTYYAVINMLSHRLSTVMVTRMMQLQYLCDATARAVAYPQGGQGDVSPQISGRDSHAKVTPQFLTHSDAIAGFTSQSPGLPAYACKTGSSTAIKLASCLHKNSPFSAQKSLDPSPGNVVGGD